MRDKTICGLVGWATGSSKVDKMIEHEVIETQLPRNEASCFKLLKLGRVDFLMWERPNVRRNVKEHIGDAGTVELQDFVAGKQEGYLMMNPDLSATLVDAWKAGISTLKSEGQ
jgi:ABC-type amino acid transport substrate-binding protein